MKITDQVIEEVDEQLTIQSMRNQEQRPTAQSIFQTGPPPPSNPVDVPTTTRSSYIRTQSVVPHPVTPSVFTNTDKDFISSSAPVPECIETPTGMYGISVEDYDKSIPDETTIAKGEADRKTTYLNKLIYAFDLRVLCVLF